MKSRLYSDVQAGFFYAPKTTENMPNYAIA